MNGLELAVPELSLVVLIGVSGSGKTTFARNRFGPYEVLSSDACRGWVSNDENDQTATGPAFDVLNYIVGKRLEAGLLTVVDATSVQREARAKLIQLARDHDVLPIAIVLNLPQKVCLERNAARPERDFGERVVRRQSEQLRRSLKGLSREGFRKVHVLDTVEQVEAATVVRERLLTDRRDVTGPFDVIGDIHGCRSELEALLTQLGYTLVRDEAGRPVDAVPPAGRQAMFVGDLVDRGPDSPGVLRLVMGMVRAGHAHCVPGNHENKLVRALSGKNVQITHGLAETLAQLEQEPAEFSAEVLSWCRDLVSHLVLDGGRLVVAHAGLKESYHGRASGRVRSFALYGDTTGETDEFGLPVRYPWAQDYRGRAMVLYGHTPTPTPEWVNNTLCLDTGCVFGGRLTALRYPEKELVSVPAERVWYEPIRPLESDGAVAGSGSTGLAGGVGSAAGREPDLLDLTDVLGKRVVETRHHGRVTIREENAAGALEVMSRFALDPRHLLYLPPTMAPCATSSRPDLLEHPDEAFSAYRSVGVPAVICEEKHMGSRAVLLLCRDEAAATRRFGVNTGITGVVHTRTGRPFFAPALSEELLARLRAAVSRAGLWDELETDWILLDAELLPWSVKAEELLRRQYASVGAAARSALPAAIRVLEAASQRSAAGGVDGSDAGVGGADAGPGGAGAGPDVAELLARTTERSVNADRFSTAYRRYCWPTDGLDGVQVAPFQVLATEGTTFHHRDHEWHLSIADRLVDADPALVRTTRRLVLDPADPEAVAAAADWWERLTADGGEGMVVKPLANLTRTRRGMAQPGIKVRGREYLRIIYGPDYTLPGNLERLRERGLGRKRSLALQEYALGLEALERVAAGEPLWRVHEAVFAVLALESEPVDPRL
jgi:protein phosphatase